MSRDICCHNIRSAAGPDGQRAGVLPNPLQYSVQPLATKNYPVPNASSAEVEKPALEHPKTCLPNPEADLALEFGFGRSLRTSVDMRPVDWVAGYKES